MKTAKRLPIFSTLVVVVVVFTTAAPAFADAVPYFAGWDVSGDTAGWLRNTIASNLAVVDTGGNPGGYLRTFGDASGTLDIGAVANKFLVPDVTGDYSGTPWVVSFDLLFISGNFDNAWLRFRFSVFTNGWRLPLTNSFPMGQWRHFTVTFDPAWSDSEAVAAGWVRESNSVSWSQTMSDVFTTEIRISAEGSAEAGIDNYRLAPVPEVDTDIKPGRDPNAINPASRGLIPVAILTTDTFDATTVSPITVQFGPDGASPEHQLGHLEDVDGDGDLDLVLHFRTQESGIQCGDTEASLTGETFDGQAIQGSDSIVTVGCN
jgi:hypothetical protein